MFADYYVYTKFSDDSVYPMEQVMKDAIAMQMHTIPQYEALFARYPLDFVILSIHQVGDKEFWTQDFQKGKTQKEYNEQYYEELLNVVNAYRKMGGEIITVGSDSHKPEHLGEYMNEAKHLLKSLGYRFFCTYNEMQPVFHAL